jgi:hypothetical protein
MRTARQRLDVVCGTESSRDQIDDSTDLEEPEPLQLH